MARSFEFIVVFAIVFKTGQVTLGQLTRFENAVEYAMKLAPIVKLHPNEKYMPISPLDFLTHVCLWKEGIGVYSASSLLPQGKDSRDFFLVTYNNKELLLDEPTSFLYGSDPSRQAVPVFAAIEACAPDHRQFTVTYWLFFAFNQGKNLCSVRLPGMSAGLPVPKLLGRWCLGFHSEDFGDHTGDWERVTIEFKNWAPSRLSLSAHSVRMEYKYNSRTKTFDLIVSTKKGLSKVQYAPRKLYLNAEGRPVIYSALGSHGLYAGPGKHKYTRVRLGQLSDATAEGGSVWDTSLDLRPFSVGAPPYWYSYGGHWGAPKSECTRFLTHFGGGTVCRYEDGPRGLQGRKPDFPCP